MRDSPRRWAQQLDMLLIAHRIDPPGELGVGHMLLRAMFGGSHEPTDPGVGAQVGQGDLLELTAFEARRCLATRDTGNSCHGRDDAQAGVDHESAAHREAADQVVQTVGHQDEARTWQHWVDAQRGFMAAPSVSQVHGFGPVA